MRSKIWQFYKDDEAFMWTKYGLVFCYVVLMTAVVAVVVTAMVVVFIVAQVVVFQ